MGMSQIGHTMKWWRPDVGTDFQTGASLLGVSVDVRNTFFYIEEENPDLKTAQKRSASVPRRFRYRLDHFDDVTEGEEMAEKKEDVADKKEEEKKDDKKEKEETKKEESKKEV